MSEPLDQSGGEPLYYDPQQWEGQSSGRYAEQEPTAPMRLQDEVSAETFDQFADLMRHNQRGVQESTLDVETKRRAVTEVVGIDLESTFTKNRMFAETAEDGSVSLGLVVPSVVQGVSDKAAADIRMKDGVALMTFSFVGHDDHSGARRLYASHMRYREVGENGLPSLEACAVDAEGNWVPYDTSDFGVVSLGQEWLSHLEKGKPTKSARARGYGRAVMSLLGRSRPKG